MTMLGSSILALEDVYMQLYCSRRTHIDLPIEAEKLYLRKVDGGWELNGE